MKPCALCPKPAEINVHWTNPSGLQDWDVCETCAGEVYRKLEREFSGTEALQTFTIEPIDVS